MSWGVTDEVMMSISLEVFGVVVWVVVLSILSPISIGVVVVGSGCLVFANTIVFGGVLSVGASIGGASIGGVCLSSSVICSLRYLIITVLKSFSHIILSHKHVDDKDLRYTMFGDKNPPQIGRKRRKRETRILSPFFALWARPSPFFRF